MVAVMCAIALCSVLSPKGMRSNREPASLADARGVERVWMATTLRLAPSKMYTESDREARNGDPGSGPKRWKPFHILLTAPRQRGIPVSDISIRWRADSGPSPRKNLTSRPLTEPHLFASAGPQKRHRSSSCTARAPLLLCGHLISALCPPSTARLPSTRSAGSAKASARGQSYA